MRAEMLGQVRVLLALPRQRFRERARSERPATRWASSRATPAALPVGLRGHAGDAAAPAPRRARSRDPRRPQRARRPACRSSSFRQRPGRSASSEVPAGDRIAHSASVSPWTAFSSVSEPLLETSLFFTSASAPEKPHVPALDGPGPQVLPVRRPGPSHKHPAFNAHRVSAPATSCSGSIGTCTLFAAQGVFVPSRSRIWTAFQWGHFGLFRIATCVKSCVRVRLRLHSPVAVNQAIGGRSDWQLATRLGEQSPIWGRRVI